VCSYLDNEEDVRGGVGDGEDGRLAQRGRVRERHVHANHAPQRVRVQVKVEILRYLQVKTSLVPSRLVNYLKHTI